MKICNIKDPVNFFQQIDKCKGRVELKTEEGDILNLKSKLVQYVSLIQTFKDPKIGEVELVFSEPEDIKLIIDYLIFN